MSAKLTVRLYAWQLEKARVICKHQGRTVSEYWRLCIEALVKAHTAREK